MHRHVKFVKKKNAGQRAENLWFFKKIRFEVLNAFCLPHVYGRRHPAVRDAEMLTANLAVRLPLAITQSNVLVYSALKFDPLLYRIRFFAGLITGNDLRFAIFVGFIKLNSRLDYLYLYYSVYIQTFNWYRFFSDFEMHYLTAIQNYQASFWYQYWSMSQTWSTLADIVRSRENAILIFLGDFRQIITRNGF